MRIDELFGDTLIGRSLRAGTDTALRGRPIRGAVNRAYDKADEKVDSLLNTTTRKWGERAINSRAGQKYIVKRIRLQMWENWKDKTGGGEGTWQDMANYILETYGQKAFESLSKQWPELGSMPQPQGWPQWGSIPQPQGWSQGVNNA